jgi:hypothetical protein
LSALRTGLLCSSGNIPGTHFYKKRIRPQSHSAAGMIISKKNFSDTIGNRTRLVARLRVSRPPSSVTIPISYQYKIPVYFFIFTESACCNTKLLFLPSNHDIHMVNCITNERFFGVVPPVVFRLHLFKVINITIYTI